MSYYKQKGFYLNLICNGGKVHGLGHIYRCLSIAHEFKKKDFKIFFFVEKNKYLKKLITSYGYNFISIDKDFFLKKNKLIKEGIFSVSIIDKKIISEKEIKFWKKLGIVLIIEDENISNLTCDFILNSNLWASKKNYLNYENSKLLIGTKYNTVENGYFKINNKNRNGLLISMGGEDPNDMTSWIITKFHEILNNYFVHICIGSAHPNPKMVLIKSKKYLKSYKIYRSPKTLIKPMSECHIAISACGITCYELCAAKIATCIIAIEEHQIKMHDYMVKLELALSMGNYKSLKISDIRKTFNSIKKKYVQNKLVNNSKFFFKETGLQNIINKIVNS